MSAKIAFFLRLYEAVRMSCRIANTNDNASVLNASIGIEKLSANRAHIISYCLRGHNRQPIGRGDFNVIVEQAQQLPLGLARGSIIDCGIVKRTWVPDNLNVRRFQCGKIVQRFGVIASIIHNDNV